jgi:hypothetical protein
VHENTADCSFTVQETQQNVSSAKQKNTAECLFPGVREHSRIFLSTYMAAAT